MAKTESVRVDTHLVNLYRLWAKAAGRTLSGQMERVLSEAYATFAEGRSAGLSDEVLTGRVESSHGKKTSSH